jgi:hypothetical protein
MAASTSNSSANIVKILINYSEYSRLKEIEEKYLQLQRKYKDKLQIEEGKKTTFCYSIFFNYNIIAFQLNFR